MAIVSCDEHNSLELRVKAIEERFGNMNYDLRGIMQSELSDRLSIQVQSENQFGVWMGLCIETIDVWKQNRIRFYCPLFHDPTSPIKKLPWAYPISPMGGFDDSGCSWVPPAGSTIALLFESGKRSSPYYLGTVWHRDRGPSGGHNWNVNIEEYYKVSAGHRSGYMVGPDDESQVFPPWNTESYNGYDLSSIVDFAESPEAQKRITYPNIYGFKTPEKHMIKMVDGDAKCNRRWKRMEIMSSTGNWMMFKDDHLHYCGQWAHPDCGVPDGDVSCVEGQGEDSGESDTTRTLGGTASDGTIDSQSLADSKEGNEDASSLDITPKQGTKKEEVPCDGKQSNKKIIGGHPSTPKDTKHYQKQKGANPFFKNRQECRPYKGPGTPQNNKCSLPQSGWQVSSLSGHTMLFDDSVEEPFGEPLWERSMESFSFGCNDVFVGRTDWISATGHRITMNDKEKDKAGKRDELNGIHLVSAAGNSIRMSDHTSQIDPCIAGEKRGITMTSTSQHTIRMIDETNEQCGPIRREGGVPVPKATKAFIQIRSGYGLEIMMADQNSQEDTVAQYMQIFCPQKDNKDCGPHIMRFQEAPSGCGLVFLRTGGYYIISTCCDKVDVVGDEEGNFPANYIEITSRHKIMVEKEMYINIAKMHIFLAEEAIFLLAGECDCPNGDECGPCAGPIAVMVNGCLRLSSRVFASARKTDTPVNIFMLDPFAKCPGDE